MEFMLPAACASCPQLEVCTLQPSWLRLSLTAAGALSIGMGAFHLFLPTVFGWADAMRNAPDSLQWALSSLNAFWSLLVLLTGVLAIGLAGKGWFALPPGRAALSALA